MKKLLFVVNPKAGRKVIKADLIDIIDIFEKAGYLVTMYLTREDKKVNSDYLYKHAADYDLVVCAGGDGTLNEIATGIIGTNSEIVVVPCGTGNDFLRSISKYNSMRKIINTSIHKTSFFIYVAAFGAFTDITYSTPQNLKNTLGHAAYIIEALGAIAKLRPYHMKVWFDGEIVEGDFIYGQVTNSLSVGGFKNFGARHMSFADGLFETVLIRNPSNPIQLQKIINSLLTENLDDELIIFRRTSKVAVKCNEEVPWTVDGEFGGNHKTARIANIRKAVSLMLKEKKA